MGGGGEPSIPPVIYATAWLTNNRLFLVPAAPASIKIQEVCHATLSHPNGMIHSVVLCICPMGQGCAVYQGIVFKYLQLLRKWNLLKTLPFKDGETLPIADIF